MRLFKLLCLPILIYGTILAQNQTINLLNESIKNKKICYKLSEPEELVSILGSAEKDSTFQSGGMLIKVMEFKNDVTCYFGKFRNDKEAPFTVLEIYIDSSIIDIGKDKKLILRNNDDLKKLDKFWGFQNVNLTKVDLSNEKELIESMSFDNLTEWPASKFLPDNFNPIALIEQGKTPGLDIEKLRSENITGKGVGIAIIDQPLLLGHKEYSSRIVRYDETGLNDMEPQMHASPVASIAVGENIGVAPEAELTFFAVPMWKKENRHYIDTMKKIFALNNKLDDNSKIRVVSISTGSFKRYPDYEEWLQVLEKAKKEGILVVTCDPDFLKYGTLKYIEGTDRNNPNNYKRGYYGFDDAVLLLPVGNRTIASHRGNEIYTYEREGGMSWAAPYIAGLAALAYQVKKDITPNEIIQLLIETVSTTDAGPVVNPVSFIEQVKKQTK